MDKKYKIWCKLLGERAVNTVMDKKYKIWCKFLGQKHRLWLSQGQQEMQQRKIFHGGGFILAPGHTYNNNV
ncbi:hypothetical protein AQUCO_00500628v1 [Aquilegia coerulea]|uniref:Uncharacterized protein n=1 Tax=Aquilegia coerulea TaxID=218851 RepID=A0A2G5ESW4_AQUCA|nr:hypothetical protein AQUCO_00500628v1 [Aquilegia coerulea]